MFGHEKGVHGRDECPGRSGGSSDGELFLDEIELPPDAHGAAAACAAGRGRRVGSVETKKYRQAHRSDAQDLRPDAPQRFREDLYYRLNVGASSCRLCGIVAQTFSN